ncbi:uncharacterized protein LOC118233104 [Anguilla anguilla]|uniref:uncharacterized protein LOC118233104 n=1 Tax=Anguilla anguilla TaxID=7936 RepID=UPI0015B00F21|nr:uncharacterized protein LOC118233104 [Anguilla anguilla]
MPPEPVGGWRVAPELLDHEESKDHGRNGKRDPHTRCGRTDDLPHHHLSPPSPSHQLQIKRVQMVHICQSTATIPAGVQWRHTVVLVVQLSCRKFCSGNLVYGNLAGYFERGVTTWASAITEAVCLPDGDGGPVWSATANQGSSSKNRAPPETSPGDRPDEVQRLGVRGDRRIANRIGAAVHRCVRLATEGRAGDAAQSDRGLNGCGRTSWV